MIDIHCHILPFIDDGPKSIDDSIEMLRYAEKDGIKSIIATPHSFNGVYICTSNTVKKSIERLQYEINNNKLSITLFPGMEVHLCEQLYQKIIEKTVVSLNNSRYILIELPVQFVPPNFKEIIFKLRLKGYYPILAHPERNFVVLNDPEIIYDFIEWGVFIQLTAASVLGFFGSKIQRLCKKMLLNRQVHFLASDAHSLENRPPALSEAYKKALQLLKDEKYAKTLIYDNPKKVIDDTSIDIYEPIRKKRFFIF